LKKIALLIVAVLAFALAPLFAHAESACVDIPGDGSVTIDTTATPPVSVSDAPCPTA
jgi:hypothetical protein